MLNLKDCINIGYVLFAGGSNVNVGFYGGSQNINTSIPAQPSNQNIMQNMEILLESINTGTFQNFDLGTWQMLMDSMKAADLQNMGVDQSQWHELAFSFSQYLHQQGIIPDANSLQRPSPSSSNSSHLIGSPQGMLQVSNPQLTTTGSPLQCSQQSYSSSASYSGSSVHSIPGIKVTPANHATLVQATGPAGIDDDDDDEEFDWDSLL